MSHYFYRLVAASIFALFTASAAVSGASGSDSDVSNASARLVMVDQKGCHYCEAWTEEIGPAYDKTAEGKFAPLLRRDIADGAPEGSTFARRVNFTPTFVLMENGQELARIEGYPGEDFFWPILTKLLTQYTTFKDQ